MANDEFREQHETAREVGLKARHETRQERAIRRQVAAEIAEAIEGYFPDPHCEGEPCEDCSLIRELAEMARGIGAKETP